MKVALTGATGFVGSHILTELHEHGHEVTALVRDDAQAGIAKDRGATPVVIDLYDRPRSQACSATWAGPSTPPAPVTPPAQAWTPQWSTRSPARSPAPASPTSKSAALWIYGNNTSITEHSPFHAPALVSWKEPIERRVLGEAGMRGTVIVSGTAYGDGGGGIPGVLLGSPRDDAGNLIMLGTGQQHWCEVHVADLADFFRRVLEDDAARGR